MFALRIDFPAHRYHATPWQNHVNEGLVEWPPSPWRVLRAFCSVGYTHLSWSEVPDTFAEIVEAFATSPPAYCLPESVETHSRHYMPVPGSTSKVLDTCRRIVDGRALWIRCEMQLSNAARELLEDLTSHTSYLGRAESWVDITVSDDVDANLDWCCVSIGSMPTLGASSTQLLTPASSDAYAPWREMQVAQRVADLQTDGQRKPTRSQLRGANAPYPETIVDCLSVDTNFLAKHGWSQPPGTHWIEYQVPSRPAVHIERTRKNRREVETLPTTALLALTSDSVSGQTLPPVGRALFVAEAIHKAAVSKYANKASDLSYALSGKSKYEKANKHGHAHFLPIDLDNDSKIDHVIVHCPAGLDFSTQKAIAAIGRIFSQQLPEIAVTWIGCGDIELLRRHIRKNSRKCPQILTSSKRFRSLTPYVASRHLRRKYQLQQNIIDECRFRDLPEAKIVDSGVPNGGKFRLARVEDQRRPPVEYGQFLTLEFPSEIRGPLMLGYASHFGLGLFEADDP